MLRYTENCVRMEICGKPVKSVKKGFADEKELDWPVQNSLAYYNI